MNINELENEYFSEDRRGPLQLKLVLLQLINRLDEKLIKEEDVAFSLQNLLEYLVSSKGNTNDNCHIVDFILTDRYLRSLESLGLSDRMQSIMEDMMFDLHDTHTYPDIAKGFNATPQQLLRRLQELQDKDR